MRTPPQRPSPTISSKTAFSGHIRPSSCPEGNLRVTLPNGTDVIIKDVVDCCWSDLSCSPCWDGQNFDQIVGKTFPQCGKNNAKKCYNIPECSLLGE